MPTSDSAAAQTQSLTDALDRLVEDALRLSTALAGQSGELTAEADLARAVRGLGSRVGSRLGTEQVAGARLLVVHPDRPGDAVVVERALSGRAGHVVAPVDGLVFALVGAWRRRGFGDAALTAAQASYDDAALRVPCTAAISPRLEALDELAPAARDLRDLLGALCDSGDRLGLVDDCWAALLTARAARALPDLLPHGSPLSALTELDGTPFRETLVVWFRSGFDARTASEHLGIHANTLRYRLRRAEELLRVDLDDPHQRVALQLWALTQPEGTRARPQKGPVRIPS